MKTRLRRAVSACVALAAGSLILFAFGHRTRAYASDADERARGAIAFHTKGCERCHSITGVGGDRAPDLSSVGLHRSGRQIKEQIVQGGHGMPPFEHVLTKDEVKDLAAFLASCRSATAPGCRDWTGPPPAQ